MAAAGRTKGCYSSRGWGPVDDARFDFVPCFEHVLYAVPVGLLFILGAVELAHLRGRDELGPKGRGPASRRLYLAKLALAGFNIATQLVLFAASILGSPRPRDDVAVWSDLVILAALIFAAPLHHYAHLRSRRSSTALLFAYLSFLVVDAIRLRTLVDLRTFGAHLFGFVVFCVRLASVLAVFILECVGPESSTQGRIRLSEDGEDADDRPECPVEFANIFSRLTFGWMTPLMRLGHHKPLGEDDLWSLPREDQADAVGATMTAKWEAQKAKKGKKGPSLARALVQAFGGPYMLAMGLKFVQDAFQFLQPQLLRRLLSFVDTYSTSDPEPVRNGYVIAVGMLACSVVQTAFLHQYFRHVFETGQRVRGGLIAIVYAKALVLSNEERSGRATGDIVNLMSTDVTRLQDCCAYGLVAVSGVFQIFLAFVSLYALMGWSAFAGVGVMVLSVPMNAVLARFATKLQKQQMKNKDQRTRMMNEILNNIRS